MFAAENSVLLYWYQSPCNFSPLSEIFALVLCTAGDNLV